MRSTGSANDLPAGVSWHRSGRKTSAVKPATRAGAVARRLPSEGAECEKEGRHQGHHSSSHASPSSDGPGPRLARERVRMPHLSPRHLPTPAVRRAGPSDSCPGVVVGGHVGRRPCRVGHREDARGEAGELPPTGRPGRRRRTRACRSQPSRDLAAVRPDSARTQTFNLSTGPLFINKESVASSTSTSTRRRRPWCCE